MCVFLDRSPSYSKMLYNYYEFVAHQMRSSEVSHWSGAGDEGKLRIAVLTSSSSSRNIPVFVDSKERTNMAPSMCFDSPPCR